MPKGLKAPKLTKAQIQAAIPKLFELYAEGMDDQEARDWMGLDRDNFQAIQDAMLKHEAEAIHARSTDETYVRYILAQTANITDLNKMVRQFHSTKQYNAMVGAIRLRSDIQDKILSRGQEFGIIDKEPETTRVIGGIVVANLGNEELRKLITRELAGLNRLQSQFGDQDDIVDITPGEIHRPLPKTVVPKKVKSRNSRHSGGRRVVKGGKAK